MKKYIRTSIQSTVIFKYNLTDLTFPSHGIIVYDKLDFHKITEFRKQIIYNIYIYIHLLLQVIIFNLICFVI